MKGGAPPFSQAQTISARPVGTAADSPSILRRFSKRVNSLQGENPPSSFRRSRGKELTG
jgi:hypothetical protein